MTIATNLAELDPGDVRALRPAKAPESATAIAWGFTVSAALGIACIYASRRYRLTLNAMILPRLAFGFLAAVVIHEAGHAAAALLTGQRVIGFAVWPIRIHRDAGNRWRAALLGWRSSKGFVSVLPKRSVGLRLRQFLCVAAGPLASVLAAVACWAAPSTLSAQPKWVGDLVVIIGLWSILFAAGGLLPIRSGSTASDGERLSTLIRGGVEWERISAQQMILAAATGGARPRDWPNNLIESAEGPDDGSAEARTGRILRYNWLVDRGAIDGAEQQIVWLLQDPSPDGSRRAMRLQAAWFAAFYKGDAPTARRWFAAAGLTDGATGDCNLSMALAALALVESRWDDAVRHSAESLAQSGKLTDRGTALAIQDALSALISRVNHLCA